MIENFVSLTGNVGQDPEVKHISDSSVVANFSMATTSYYRNKEGNTSSKSQWHSIVAWFHLAKLAENHIKKGSLVQIIGSIEYQEFNDKDGNRRSKTVIIAKEIKLLGSKGNNQSDKDEFDYGNDLPY